MERYQITTFEKYQSGSRVFDRSIHAGLDWYDASGKLELAGADVWEATYAMWDGRPYHYTDSHGRICKLEVA